MYSVHIKDSVFLQINFLNTREQKHQYFLTETHRCTYLNHFLVFLSEVWSYDHEMSEEVVTAVVRILS